MTLHIRNMVCNRCIMVVGTELEKMGLHPLSVSLGYVELKEALTDSQFAELNKKLVDLGFEILDDRKSRIIEKIKNELVTLAHYTEEQPRENISSYLSSRLHHDYNYLSSLFSESEGTTIEKYFIAQKIERVKELLEYDELTLSGIALEMGYSSVAHLSSQFKKVTGQTPSQYKTTLNRAGRTPLDKL
ncbi:helix-turn-helix domain-containing protein [Sediminibacterium ginsengisoli]|uniref:AraC-type DNA-binding protein n=1 Tax=Sediminibacterium ginsengisoli TaxID=413434 RepID=A0A1T4MDR0_9BACT|nr:AraC family transcriptional regulator [Sediminibacterium ginsengisoli]SJZ64908.1 AraC-type DNA-binding protein [Sediminibacterium ginsengisoli]